MFISIYEENLIFVLMINSLDLNRASCYDEDQGLSDQDEEGLENDEAEMEEIVEVDLLSEHIEVEKENFGQNLHFDSNTHQMKINSAIVTSTVDSSSEVYSLKYSLDGEYLAVGHGDGRILVYSGNENKIAFTLKSSNNSPITSIKWRPNILQKNVFFFIFIFSLTIWF